KHLSENSAPWIGHGHRVQVFSSLAPHGVRRQDRSRYARLTAMQRTAVAPSTTRFSHGVSSAWLSRRWYYTPKSRRAYSVRQISPGDRRLLAEFALGLTRAAPERELAVIQEMNGLLFDHVISSARD